MTEFEYKTIIIDSIGSSGYSLIGIAQKAALIFKRRLCPEKGASE